jgi:hypothetical protein
MITTSCHFLLDKFPEHGIINYGLPAVTSLVRGGRPRHEAWGKGGLMSDKKTALVEHRRLIDLICDKARSVSKTQKAYYIKRLREIEAEHGLPSTPYNGDFRAQLGENQ